ncbi:metallophosphatase domain-containing protein [Aspergillus homomorphus CBS 101889]|uniref:Putative phosphoric ester hydrolase n=1 Tax=Aspergillus homomorphus (strain CBS 101889) TaxID=1450537 RepID=A0A395HZM2_ASPHC|nr:putative phosphoric ester hydrolase [Aspergillus homomorphus CBS 101889]RAL12879.1 putative phosphoric ester hydrolase [Aspergillus homomorphus CBS 101889]
MSSPFNPRPFTDYIIFSPLAAFIYPVHHLLNRLRGPPRLPPPNARPIRVVCISDTHTLEWSDIPDGDLLIHAGDLSNDGSVREIQQAVNWLRSLPHTHKVVICGNHDSFFDVRSRRPEDRDDASSTTSYATVSSSTASLRSLPSDDLDRVDWGDIHYLQHTSVTLTFPPTSPPPPSPSPPNSTTPLLHNNHHHHHHHRTRTLTLYGAPQIPAIAPLGPEHAFTYPPHHDAWTGTVPATTDILITHTPPSSHLDLSPIFSTGCPSLLAETWRVRPALHVFGHIHAAYGLERVYYDEAQRAWERLCAARRPRARLSRFRSLVTGGLRDLFDVAGWVDAARVVVYGVLGIVWAKVWGGENAGCGWMVNAACMYRDEGVLRNKPQVVVL